MSVYERIVPAASDRAAGLTALSVVLAAALVIPLGWLVVEVFGLGRRALSLAVAPTTLWVLARSIALVAMVTGLSVVVGASMAVLTVHTDLPFRRFWTVVGALPLAIPSYLGALSAVSAFGPYGVLADALSVERLPAIKGFLGAAVVLTLYTYPYVFLTTRAALLSLDGSLVEAARTLNADRATAFRRVTLPQIAPAVAAGALLVALYTLADFGTPNIMDVEVFTQFIYARYNAFQRGYAALLSLQLFAVTAVILFLESRVGADDSGAYTSRGNRGSAELRLGRWRYFALLFPAAIAVVTILLPICVFLLWLTRGGPGYHAGRIAFSWSYGWNSVFVSLLAAGGSVLVALPIAGRAASDSKIAQLAGRIPYLGYAAPGIVLAIALLQFSLDLFPALNKTIPLLVFAYIIRFVPQSIGSIQASTQQLDSRLVEAARTLGRSQLRAFKDVTLPLLAPGIAAGTALVFLTTMKELPATLLLRPLGFDTVVTYIWRVQEAGLYGQAAVPALVLIGVSGLSMAVLINQEG